MSNYQIQHEVPHQQNDFTLNFDFSGGQSFHRLFNLTLIAVIEVMVIGITSTLSASIKTENKLAELTPVVQTETNGVVLAEESEPLDEEIVDESFVEPAPLPTSRPTPKKNSYKIAVVGDSMVDTMGERLEYLEHELKALYPETEFVLYNYGIGSQTVSDGLARIDSPLRHMDRTYAPIKEVKPDIIVVGSFAYNPYTPHDRDKHWLELTKMVQYLKTISGNVYMLSEIAPLRVGFGEGPMGVNWEKNTVFTHTGHIVEQLQNVAGLAKTLNIPLIDAFIPTVTNTDFNGTESLVNASDHIHPSVEGHIFMAKTIAEAIELK